VDNIFFINPYYLLFIAFFCQCMIIFLYIWRSNNKINRTLIYTHPGLFIFGIFFIGITWSSIFNIIVGISQGLYYWSIQYLFPILLVTLLSIEYFWGTFFILPSRRSLITHGFCLLSTIFICIVVLPIYNEYILVILMGVVLLFSLIINSLIKFFPFFRIDQPISNRTNIFFKIFSFRINGILFLIVMIEFFLQNRGYSLILWI